MRKREGRRDALGPAPTEPHLVLGLEPGWLEDFAVRVSMAAGAVGEIRGDTRGMRAMSARTDRPALLHAPGAESGVILLLGLLWDYLPVRFAFENFEVAPPPGQTKYVDARGYVWTDNGWEPTTIEFKVRSSQLLRDVQQHRDFRVGWLICWEDDAGSVIRRYVDHVLALAEVWRALPEEVRGRLVGNAGPSARRTGPVDISSLLAKLSPHHRSVVEALLAGWPEHVPGTREIMLRRNRVTVLRIGADYLDPHIIIKPEANLPRAFVDRLLRLPRAEAIQEGTKVPLDSLTPELVEEILALMKAASP